MINGKKILSDPEKYACLICGKSDSDKPMCFRGENYCSDTHRKMISASLTELPPTLISEKLIKDLFNL